MKRSQQVGRLPVQIAEPKKRTTWTYNGDGGTYCVRGRWLAGRCNPA